MKKVLLTMAVLMSMSMVGCERMKTTYDKMKFWERDKMSDALK